MTVGLDYVLQASPQNLVRITFEQEGWTSSVFAVHGVVAAYGYEGYFTGGMGLWDLREFLGGLQRGVRQEQRCSLLRIYADEDQAYCSEDADETGRISVEFSEPHFAQISGAICAPCEYQSGYAKLHFQFNIALESLKDSLWDLRTIYDILELRHKLDPDYH